MKNCGSATPGDPLKTTKTSWQVLTSCTQILMPGDPKLPCVSHSTPDTGPYILNSINWVPRCLISVMSPKVYVFVPSSVYHVVPDPIGSLLI